MLRHVTWRDTHWYCLAEERDDVCIDLMDTDQISLVQSVCLLTGFTVDNGAAMSVSGF